MSWKRKRRWTADALCRLDSSLTPRYDSELDLGSPAALILRDEESSEEDRPFLSRFLLQEMIFAHSRYEQPAKPAGESSVQIRLASLARNFRDRVHDFPDSRPRCFPSLQCVLKVQSRESALRRNGPCQCQHLSTLPAGSRIKCLGQGAWAEQTAHALARPLEVGFGYDWSFLPLCPQTGTSVSGTISATAPSPRAHPRPLPVRSSPFCSRKSPHHIRLLSLRGVAHTECATVMFQATVHCWRQRHLRVSRLIAAVFAVGLTPSTRAHQGPLASAWKSSHQS